MSGVTVEERCPHLWRPEGGPRSSAVFDMAGVFRLRLRREWGAGVPHAHAGGKGATPWEVDKPTESVVFVMLNPSTADHRANDPTVRRCIDFAYRWGYGALEVVNLFALRSPDPRVLYAHGAPVGLGNDEAILAVAKACSLVVCAWGNHGAHLGRGVQVLDMLRAAGHGDKLRHLGLTNDGFPKHPLARGKHYIPSTAEPLVFQEAT